MSLDRYFSTKKRKVPADENEKPASDDSPAAKRKRQAATYREEWAVGRHTWLYYVPNEGMYCRLCQKYNKCPYDRDTWNKTPCRRLRLVSVKEHEQSVAHNDSVKLELMHTTTQNIGETVQPEVKEDAIVSAFKCLYHLAKRRIPHTTNFEPLLDLLTELGLSVKEDLNISKNVTYCSDKSVQDMLLIISNVLEDETIDQLKRSDYFTVMLDETSDVSVNEQLTLNCRFIDEHGKLCVKFLKLIEPLEFHETQDESPTISLNAETIAGHVASFFREKDLNFDGLVGIGTDGAAVMTGKHNGVVKRLQRLASTAIGIHCCGHRLQLASSQAASAVPVVKKFYTVLRQLYDFFNNSAVRMAGLHAVQKTFGEKVLKPIEPSSTRWLSIDQSVARLKETFRSVLVSLEREGEERGDMKAIGLYHTLSSYSFIATMLLLCDVLPHLSKLSKAFQAREFEHSLLKPLVMSTLTTLAAMDRNGGENFGTLGRFIDELQKLEIIVKKRATDESTVKKVVEQYIGALVSNIEQRFPCEDVGILSCFDVFDTNSLQVNQSPEYGNDSVRSLSSHFLQKPGQLDTTADAVNEWTNFKNYARNSVLKQPDIDPHSLVELLCTNKVVQQVFPTMSKLAQIYRVLPCHTADSERVFSQLKIIKTTPRNRLCQSSIDSLVRIAVDGPTVADFKYKCAVEMWAKKKHRRLYNWK